MADGESHSGLWSSPIHCVVSGTPTIIDKLGVLKLLKRLKLVIYIYYIQLFVSNSNPISISSIKLVDIPIHFHWLVIYIIPLKLGVLSPIVTTSPFCCLINEHESHFSWWIPHLPDWYIFWAPEPHGAQPPCWKLGSFMERPTGNPFLLSF